MSRIKVARAKKHAKIGPYHGSFEAMLESIPSSVVASLTARQLGELIDANWRLAARSKSIGEKEARAGI